MTKESYIEMAKGLEITNNKSLPSGRYLGYYSVEEIINSIFNDFENKDKLYKSLNDECIRLREEIQEFKNRTCDSCKYYKEINNACGFCTNILADATNKVLIDFGCNKWEQK